MSSRVAELLAEYGDTQSYVIALESEVERLTARVAELEGAGRWLLQLKDGPRDERYADVKGSAWLRLRLALAADKETT